MKKVVMTYIASQMPEARIH